MLVHYDGEQLGQGKENARNFLIKNADVAAEIESKIKGKLGIGLRPRPPLPPQTSWPPAAPPDDRRRPPPGRVSAETERDAGGPRGR